MIRAIAGAVVVLHDHIVEIGRGEGVTVDCLEMKVCDIRIQLSGVRNKPRNGFVALVNSLNVLADGFLPWEFEDCGPDVLGKIRPLAIFWGELRVLW